MSEKPTTTAATVVSGPTPHQNNSIRERSIKVSGEPTPSALRQFSQLRRICPNRHNDPNRHDDLCLADLDNPQNCELGLCLFFDMDVRQRAAFLELMENED